MPQPVKKTGTYQKPRSKTVKKRKTAVKKEEVKEGINRLPSKKNVKKRYGWRNFPHPEYGTSKLEERFAHDFLDKLGIKYEAQFKAESIGRYYDFYLPEHRILIEIDGDYYHSYGLVYEQMNAMQKRNKRVDDIKNHWAAINGIPLMRIWEHDINEHPTLVMAMLKQRLYIVDKDNAVKDEKKRRH